MLSRMRQEDTFGEGTPLSDVFSVFTVNLLTLLSALHPVSQAGGLGSDLGFALTLLRDLGQVDCSLSGLVKLGG